MKFSELVNVDELRRLCESYTAVTGAVTALLELDGNILLDTGWQDICTHFHRVNAATACRCRESDTDLAGTLRDGESYNIYKCKNGLIDVAVPIIIRGEHVANFFTGQFLSEEPNLEYFIRQAEEFGFEKEAYLAALKRVPIFSEDTIKAMMTFFTRLAKLIGEMGLARMELLASNERLLRNSNMLSHIMNSIPQSIFWKDLKSVYLGCNRVFSSRAGLASPDDIIGKSDFDLPWSREESEGYRADDREVMDSAKSKIHIVETQRQADGKVVWADTTKIPLLDASGSIIGVLGVYEDITDRKNSEEEKIKLESQLRQMYKMESVGRLAGGVAHDFNNMLSVILGYVNLAEMEADPAQPLYQYLEEIRKSAERSADLTRQLLAFARKQTVAPKVLDLNATISGMLKMLQRLIGEDINLIWNPADDLWPIKVDPSQIDQILANLCVNARDSISNVGRVMIATGNITIDKNYITKNIDSLPGEYVTITISDDGCGMNEETMSHIFEPFFTTKEVGEGTGLGLATVFGAVKQNNGFVALVSEPGIGTKFTIYLPRYAGRIENLSTERDFAPAPRGAETILLVEDEAAILNMVSRFLTSQGYTVLKAKTPTEGIQLAKEYSHIHLLMTDVIMPEMNGRALANDIISIHPSLKCVFMSGYTSDVIAHHGVLEDGVNFIQKPFSLRDLVTKVRNVLDDTEAN
ncbi:MAG: PocR ligand-binding domain-containing protein [Candidatus Riflebacteria bacterium]|nr:PocR ligand-binding domain-containing protein [Candidatus Riflebacteria bacterium]